MATRAVTPSSDRLPAPGSRSSRRNRARAKWPRLCACARDGCSGRSHRHRTSERPSDSTPRSESSLIQGAAHGLRTNVLPRTRRFARRALDAANPKIAFDAAGKRTTARSMNGEVHYTGPERKCSRCLRYPTRRVSLFGVRWRASGAANAPTSKPVCLPCFAPYRTVLRSLWWRSGVDTASVASTSDRGPHATRDILRLGLVASAYWIRSPQTMQPLINRILGMNFAEWIFAAVGPVTGSLSSGAKRPSN